MDSLLEVLRTFNLGARPPATKRQLRRLEDALGCTLPGHLAALYRAFDGQDASQSALGFRLLRLDEVHALIMDGEWLALPPEAQAFFTDDHGNYAFVYLTGPLQGMMGVNDQVERFSELMFRSVPSFMVHLIASGNRGVGLNFREMSCDYPARIDRHPPTALAADRALSAQYWQIWAAAEDGPERLSTAWTAMTLLPHQDSDQLIPFVLNTEMGVAEMACTQLGLRAWVPAIPALHLVAVSGPWHVRCEAARAIGQIPFPAAARALVDVLKRWSPTETWAAAMAVQQHGYTVVLEADGTGQVRERHGKPWVPFPDSPLEEASLVPAPA